MARFFRVWEKKRGHRHTGSALVGSVGEALFFGMLFVLGAVCLASVGTSQLFRPTPEIYAPGFGFWLMVMVLTSFILIGGGGVLYTVVQVGASVERRSAMVRRAADIDLIRDALPSQRDYPTVPRDGHLTNSPGVELAYRLPPLSSSTWRLWIATAFCLIFSGTTSVLAVVAANSHLRGNPEWFLTLFLVPLIVGNAWTIVYFVRRLWKMTRIGPTCVEISEHPLRPGGEYAIFLSQAGRCSLRSLGISLICAEEATYHQGTDIRTELRTVYESSLFRNESTRIDPSTPFEVRTNLSVPADAMHSFRSGHNAVQWKLVVEAQPDIGDLFTRIFPVVVYPPRDETVRT